MAQAAVFPEPVSALAKRSLQLRMGEKVLSWIGVSSSYPMPVRVSRISGFKSKSENFIANPQMIESILNSVALPSFFPKTNNFYDFKRRAEKQCRNKLEEFVGLTKGPRRSRQVFSRVLVSITAKSIQIMRYFLFKSNSAAALPRKDETSRGLKKS